MNLSLYAAGAATSAHKAALAETRTELSDEIARALYFVGLARGTADAGPKCALSHHVLGLASESAQLCIDAIGAPNLAAARKCAELVFALCADMSDSALAIERGRGENDHAA